MKFAKVIGGFFSFQIAPEYNTFATEKEFRPFRVINGKHFGESGLGLLRLNAGQDLTAEREVEPVHPALSAPVSFLFIPFENVRSLGAFYQNQAMG